MQTRLNFRRLGIIAAIAVGVVLALAGQRPFPPRRAGAPANALLVIARIVMQALGFSMIRRRGLSAEPFVAGVPEMIDVLVQDIPARPTAFGCYFPHGPFRLPEELTWLRGDMGGNYPPDGRAGNGG